MKIEVLQEQLLSGLMIVSRAVAARAQLPILSHVLIEAKNEGLVLSATDLEIGIKIMVAAKVVEGGRVAVPAKMFGEFLGSLNPGKVELNLEKESLILSAPGYKGKFQTINAEEFPLIAEVKKETDICRVPFAALAGAVERVVFASAKDSLRPVLTGVLWEMGKKNIRLVATDGFRVAVEELTTEIKTETPNLLVPSRVVMEVVRMATEGEIVIGHLPSTNQVYFVVGNFKQSQLPGNFLIMERYYPRIKRKFPSIKTSCAGDEGNPYFC